MLTISSTALTVIWIVLLVLFLILEAATVQLVSAWFALGALCALLANLCGVGVVWQVVLFLVVSAICLIATRPLVKKMTATKIQKTNADRCIGAEAVVLEEINNLKSTGLVKAMGNTWTARSEDGSVIPKDAVVIVRKMEGVKLIVSQQSQKQ
ncbi:MAG: NfeD family protein [Clostridia bacterium]|nr:NfeD family protein [Clostridia bacterium]